MSSEPSPVCVALTGSLPSMLAQDSERDHPEALGTAAVLALENATHVTCSCCYFSRFSVLLKMRGKQLVKTQLQNH